MPILETLRAKRPLVHCISNIVTANDCANLALAVGASPIMAQAPQEMACISAAADAVVVNTGTPSEEKFAACRAACRAAAAKGIPLVMDPVGVGASPWRLQNVQMLLSDARPTILRANYSEALALVQGGGSEHGVDSFLPAGADTAALARALANRLECVVLLSGVDDLVTDGHRLCAVTGGSDRMRTVTGAGCMLSVLCGTFAAAAPDALTAAAQAALFWKLCARQAETAGRGAGSFRVGLFDAASTLSPTVLEQAALRLTFTEKPIY
ncbi:MAG: hydroxyethylthiazole kinase [Gemmiger sp.]